MSGTLGTLECEEISVSFVLGKIVLRHTICSNGSGNGRGELVERVAVDGQGIYCSSCRKQFELKDNQTITRLPVVGHLSRNLNLF